MEENAPEKGAIPQSPPLDTAEGDRAASPHLRRREAPGRTPVHCRICGRRLPEKKGRRGPPVEYHKDCRELNNLLDGVGRVLSREGFAVTRKKSKSIRSRLHRLACYLNDRQDADPNE